MFLFIDESEEWEKKVIGGILLPIEKIPDIEKQIVEERIKAKLFGEIKWNSIEGKYAQAYIKTLDVFMVEEDATFHSCSYLNEKYRYKAAYMLIRAVSWKIENYFKKKQKKVPPLYVLFDNGGKFGSTSYPKIKEILANDKDFHMQLEFCNHGHSHILGMLQISDVLVGAVAASINKVRINNDKKSIIEIIKKNNNGQVGMGINRFLGLYDDKMHHFDLDRLKPFSQ